MPDTEAPGQPPEKRVLPVRGFGAGTLLRLTLLGASFSIGLVILACGVAALFGAEVMHFEGDHVTGWAGLGLALIMAPVFSGLIALPAWAGLALGVWVVTRFRPLAVEYRPAGGEAREPPKE